MLQNIMIVDGLGVTRNCKESFSLCKRKQQGEELFCCYNSLPLVRFCSSVWIFFNDLGTFAKALFVTMFFCCLGYVEILVNNDKNKT